MYLHLHNYLTVFYSNMSNKHKHEQSQMNTMNQAKVLHNVSKISNIKHDFCHWQDLGSKQYVCFL